MTRSAIVAEDAQQDIRDIRRWYFARGGTSLDARFADSIQRALGWIELFPELGRVVHGSMRRLLLKSFPYMLLYEVEEQALVVHRCIHLSSDPMRWRAVEESRDA